MCVNGPSLEHLSPNRVESKLYDTIYMHKENIKHFCHIVNFEFTGWV